MQNLERRILELELRINRFIYLKSKSKLKIFDAIENEDFEKAAEERDHIVLFDKKTKEIENQRIELIQNR
jgi:hypothetical protein